MGLENILPELLIMSINFIKGRMSHNVGNGKVEVGRGMSAGLEGSGTYVFSCQIHNVALCVAYYGDNGRIRSLCCIFSNGCDYKYPGGLRNAVDGLATKARSHKEIKKLKILVPLCLSGKKMVRSMELNCEV